MYLQNYFMQHTSLGFDKDEVITVDISRIKENRDAFTHQIKSFSGIEEVTYSMMLLSSADIYMNWGTKYQGESIQFHVFPVQSTFPEVMGIEVTEGRSFREEDAQSERGVFLFNETARNNHNIELNTLIHFGGEIVGFIPDIKFSSFRVAVEPMAFLVGERWNKNLNYAYIKVKAGTNMRAAMDHIHATLAGYDAEYPFEVRFYDEILQHLYDKETSLTTLISLFSFIAIFISIMGVFGLVVFDSECRRKEIGIRKVHGASIMEIILMFNKLYFNVLIICFVIAAPLAWYAVHHWLKNFAYKTPIYWWVYLLAFGVVAMLTIFTVTFQNWRVANENPVKAIKTE
jgi:putative ABC transport system permease protein